MANVKMPLTEEVEFIISKLSANGFRADVVGGAVRDFLLGNKPGDYDITTSATPDEMKAVFRSEKLVDTGIKHGTVSVILNHKAYEVTSYRIDGSYLDARHPENVSFTRNINEDLSRRDFTVNAMAYSPRYGFLDLFGGMRDLEKRVIRAVGDPETRFCEDALRILRALRFASVLDFEIEEKTAKALVKCAPLLKKVSVERIYTEWLKLLSGKGSYRIIKAYESVIKIFITELENIVLPEKEKFDKSSSVLRFVSLFIDKSPDTFLSALNRLHADNKTKLHGKVLLENFRASSLSRSEMKLMLLKIGEEHTKSLLEFRWLLSIDNKEEFEILDSIIKGGECYKLSALEIRGNDLISLGIRGKKTGEILEALLISVIKGKIKNETKELLAEAVKLARNT